VRLAARGWRKRGNPSIEASTPLRGAQRRSNPTEKPSQANGNGHKSQSCGKWLK